MSTSSKTNFYDPHGNVMPSAISLPCHFILILCSVLLLFSSANYLYYCFRNKKGIMLNLHIGTETILILHFPEQTTFTVHQPIMATANDVVDQTKETTR